MTNNEGREDWPFGPFLAAAISRSGMSKRAVARAANISEGRLRQLETGYQKSGTIRIPVTTTPQTVSALADVLGFDVWDGLRLADLEGAIPDEETRRSLDEHARTHPEHPRNPELARFGFDELVEEIRARYDEALVSPSRWVSNQSGRPIPPDHTLVATNPELRARTRRAQRRYEDEVDDALAQAARRGDLALSFGGEAQNAAGEEPQGDAPEGGA